MVDSTVNKSMTLQPEYIENFIKDLLSNIYSVDPETGEATGIGAESPLYGKPVTDADGNPVYDQQAVLDADGNEMLNEFGEPIMENVLDQSSHGRTSLQHHLLERRYECRCFTKMCHMKTKPPCHSVTTKLLNQTIQMRKIKMA